MREVTTRATDARHAARLAHAGSSRVSTSSTQRALIVNGSRDVLEVLEPVLDAGNYDVVFVESSAHAYSQVRRVQPDLVILCLEFDDTEGLHVLSMLKLDATTRDIPVVTYTSAGPLDIDEQDDEPPATLFATAPAVSRMN